MRTSFMTNLLIVLTVTLLLIYFLFIRSWRKLVVLSAWRWIVLMWGLLGIVNLTSPVVIARLPITATAVVYLMAWVALFVFGDLMGMRLARPRSNPGDAPSGPDYSAQGRVAKALLLISLVGAVGFAYVFLAGGGDSSGLEVMAELRDLQVGSDSSLAKTVFTFMAFAGLPASLLLISKAIATGTEVPILAWVAALSGVSKYILTSGRQGIVITGIVLLVTIVGGLQLREKAYKPIRSLVAPMVAVLVAFVVYFSLIVGHRSNIGGTIDNKLAFVENVFDIRVDPGFRESMRPLGPGGDMAIELYSYLSTQVPGFSLMLSSYQGPVHFGIGLVPFIARRLESLAEVKILDPIEDATKVVFLEKGMPANFYRSAANSTFLAYRGFGGLVCILFCGFLAGRTRKSLMLDPTPLKLALQCMICAGAAFTIVYSPSEEEGWIFPMVWLLLLAFLYSVRSKQEKRKKPPITVLSEG